MLLNENQLLGKDSQQSPSNINHKFSEEHEPADQLNNSEDDVDDDVVPVEVRPGHIRFGSSNKGLMLSPSPLECGYAQNVIALIFTCLVQLVQIKQLRRVKLQWYDLSSHRFLMHDMVLCFMISSHIEVLFAMLLNKKGCKS